VSITSVRYGSFAQKTVYIRLWHPNDNEEANLVVGCGSQLHHSRFRSARMCICDSPISSLFLLFEHRRIGPTTDVKSVWNDSSRSSQNKGRHGSLAFVIWDIPARTIDKIVLYELGADSPPEIMPKHQFCIHCLTPHLRGSTLLSVCAAPCGMLSPCVPLLGHSIFICFVLRR
jgi:hypothetical protein